MVRGEDREELQFVSADQVDVWGKTDAGLATDAEIVSISTHLHPSGFEVGKQRNSIHRTTSS